MADPITIGVLCPVAGGFYFGGVLSGVAAVVAPVGGRVVSIQTLDPGLDNGYEASLRAPAFSLPIGRSHVAGFISVAEAVQRPYLEQIRAAGKPIVTVSNEINGFRCPNVVPDNRGGIIAGVEHLIAHGHRRIAFVGNMVQKDIRERYGAYRKALLRHGIDPDPHLLFPAENNIAAGGVAAGRALVAAGVPSTALVAATDRNAIGVIRALREAGLSLPQDQAIVGFDGVEEAAQIRPALSTATVRFDRLGGLAGHLLLRQLAGESLEPGQYAARTSFVIRASCGCRAATPGTLPGKPSGAAAVETGGTGGAGGAIETGGAGGAPGEAGGAGGAGDAADRLASRLRAILVPESAAPESVVGRLTEVVDATVDAFARAARAGVVLDAGELTPLAEEYHALGARREAVGRVVHALRGYIIDLVSVGAIPGGYRYLFDGTLLELALAIGQVEMRERTGYHVYLENTMTAQYDVGMALLRSDQNDPGALSWFNRTRASSGCLGLWVDGPKAPPGGPLAVTGVYGTGKELRGLLGCRLPVSEFPPRAVLDRVDAAAGEVVFVVSVKADESDWGLLAAPGMVNAHSTSARENLNHWAALLAVSLEQKSRRDELTAGYERERELVDSLRTSEERYALAARAANDGLWDWDLAEDTIFYSARWSALLGCGEGTVGASPGEWFSRVHPDDRSALEAAVQECRLGVTQVLEHEHRVQVSDGSYRWMLCRALAIRGDGSAATRMVGSLTDIDEQAKLAERLRLGALYDSLTGLANRALFLERLAWAIDNTKRRPDISFAVLFCDIDDFRVINDSLGHLTGDLLLTRVAGRIVEAIRSTDVAARLGGDEFAILLNDVDLAEIPEVVRRVQEGIGSPFDLDGHEVVVTASIGVAVSEAGYDHPVDVLRDADTAMHQAKSRERGTHQVFDVAMHNCAVRRLRMEVDLRQALDRRQFELHYQPLVHLEDATAYGFEALLRWHHPERGFIPPVEFLGVAEETGLILPLGKWIIEEACRQIAEWRAAGYPYEKLSVNVNISNRQFWHGGLLQQVEQALEEHQLSPEYLRLEITEGVIMYSPDQARRTMEELDRHGLRLHIDDFGTGYSSLESLHRFPMEALKIDRSFVAALGSDDVAPELVRAIVAMGRAIGVSVIAEGVETAEQAQLLCDLGCHCGQGYYFGRPQPGRDAGALIGQVLPSRRAPAALARPGASR